VRVVSFSVIVCYCLVVTYEKIYKGLNCWVFMVLKKMFETGKGSLYFRNSETGIWTRECHDGHVSTPKVYVGSLDPARSDVVVGSDLCNPRLVSVQIAAGMVPGFVPGFRVGYFPLGLVLSPEDILEVGDEVIRVPIEKAGFGVHIGHSISRVF